MTSFRRASGRPINSSTPDRDEPIQLESPSLIESEANVMPGVGRGRGNRNRGLTPALVVVVWAAMRELMGGRTRRTSELRGPLELGADRK